MTGNDATRRVVRRAVTVHLMLGVAVLLVSAFGTYLASRAIARADAVNEAEQTGAALADVVVGPLLIEALNGNAASLADLDRAIATQIRRGGLTRVKVWDADGLCLYSDEHELMGRRFPLSENARKAIADGRSHAGISALDEPENVAEAGSGLMVEVYVPLQIGGVRPLAFEAYFDYAPVQDRTEQLTREMVPVVVAALVALQIAQVPIAMSLARRVGRHQEERSQLLRRALSASEQERRLVASTLHDEVVQDLAGVSYLLSAVEKSLPGEQRRLVGTARSAVQEAVSALRHVMVEIYPPDLAEGGLAQALAALAKPLRDDGLLVDIEVDVPPELSAPVAATLYRLAREAFRNVAVHARANRVAVRLWWESTQVMLRIDDDGIGLPSSGIDRRAEGHLGLRMLADAVVDLGGRFEAATRPEGGTRIRVSLPIDVPDEQR